MQAVGRLCACACRQLTLKEVGATCWTSNRSVQSSSLLRAKSDDDSISPKVSLSPDGSSYVCWHPEPKFPYEYTQPLPRKDTELEAGNSVLKVQYVLDEQQKYRPEGPTDKELAEIFFTTRHPWDPKPRNRYRRKTGRQREGI